METTEPNASIENDVLHLGSTTKLSAEDIAKAVAHHNRHHGGNQTQDAGPKTPPNKKKK